MMESIIDYRKFELYGKTTFEKVVGCPPMRQPVRMPNEACFYYIIEGESRNYTPDGVIPLSPKDGLVLQCGNYFTEFVKTTTSERFEAIAIHLYPEVLKVIYDKDFPNFLAEVDRVRPVKSTRLRNQELVTTYIKSLEFYFENPDMVSDELQKLKLRELMLLLARTDNAQAVRNLVEGLFNTARHSLRTTVEANLYNQLSVEELAFICGMSLSTFKREFRKTFGEPPARYVRHRRLEKAGTLLKTTDLRVSDVAYDCGFNDLAHFSKLFSSEYGVAPSQFRRQ